MGNQQAYRDRVADGSLRTTNAAGYVSGGPAASPTQGWYDCNNLVNDSTNNTGLTVLPHQTGTGKDAGRARPLNLWYSRGNPGGANGCPDFPRELGANNAPNYGANPTQLCPYLTASGATVFNGPVYRYDDDAEDNSARWPEYWDGRWFLQDFGNNSAKHGLLLDPATDQDGGKPVYADSLRGVLNWQANYMDSKFGPDGALYVQVYAGLLHAPARRRASTGSPTPAARTRRTPTRSGPRPAHRARSASRSAAPAASPTSGTSATAARPRPSATPTHTYAAAGHLPGELTVTYADGEELSKTVQVNVSADATVPATTAQTHRHQPGRGPAERDRRHGRHRRRVDRVPHRRRRLDAQHEHRHGRPVRHDLHGPRPGRPHGRVPLARPRGQRRGSAEVGLLHDPARPAGAAPACRSPTSSAARRSTPSGRCCARTAAAPRSRAAAVGLPILQGDFIANDALAKNTLLQDAPSGEWTVTTRLDTSAIDANGEQAGLVIWKSESPNTFSKIVAIRSGAGNYQFEHIVTQDGGVNPPIPSSITPAPGGQLPDQVLLRARYDGTKVIGEFSRRRRRRPGR